MKKFFNMIITALMVLILSANSKVLAFPSSLKPGSTSLPGNIQGMGNTATGYIWWFGFAVALGMLIYVGIKYTMASANEKADLKSASVKYIAGAIIIVGATSLFTILQNVATEVTQ